MSVTELEVLTVPIDDVIPNEWNPNRMDERTYEAARESIREYGFIDPVTVRPHPLQKGKWEILDGEHRHRGAKDEGYDEVKIANVGEMSDVAAKKLTIIFNETRGEADLTLLGILVAGLNDALEESRELLRLGLPYSDAEIENLLAIGATDWDQWAAAQDPVAPPEPPEPAPDGTETVFLHMTPEQKEKYVLFIEIIQREREQPDPTSAVLYALREIAESI